jgi:hypothetical protein
LLLILPAAALWIRLFFGLVTFGNIFGFMGLSLIVHKSIKHFRASPFHRGRGRRNGTAARAMLKTAEPIYFPTRKNGEITFDPKILAF